MARGWRLTKTAWALIRRDPTMISIALMGAGCGLAGAAALLYFSGYFNSPTHSRGDLALAAIIGLYPMTFLSVFFNVALAGAAAASFDGRPIGVREALGISWRRLSRIAQWSLLAAGVGLILEQLASRIPGAGRLASWLLGAAWSLATIFAVPLLALEGAGPLETAKESVHLIKSKWGEGITGLVGIGAWTVFAMIPVGILLRGRRRDKEPGCDRRRSADRVRGRGDPAGLRPLPRHPAGLLRRPVPLRHRSCPTRVVSPPPTSKNRSVAAAAAADRNSALDSHRPVRPLRGLRRPRDLVARGERPCNRRATARVQRLLAADGLLEQAAGRPLRTAGQHLFGK